MASPKKKGTSAQYSHTAAPMASMSLGRRAAPMSKADDIVDFDSTDLDGNPIEKISHVRLEKYEDFNSFYRTISLLGEGSFGKVKLVESPNGTKRAAKIVKKHLGQTEAMIQMDREILILKKVRHLSIVSLVDVFETSDKQIMVFEYCEAGDLSDAINSRLLTTEAEVKRIFKQILSGVAYLHEHQVVHRDIKPANILLTRDADGVLMPKISDFGLVTFVEACDTIENYAGTPLYMAPEVVRRNGYSQQCDIWSLGIILYEMLASVKGFVSSSDLHNMFKEHRIDYPELWWRGISEPAQHLTTLLLRYNPAERATASEALRHEWLIDDSVLASSNNRLLPNVIDMMRSYNAERRLKKCMLAVRAALRLSSISSFKWANTSTSTGKGVEPVSSLPKYITDSSRPMRSRSSTVSSAEVSRPGARNRSSSISSTVSSGRSAIPSSISITESTNIIDALQKSNVSVASVNSSGIIAGDSTEKLAHKKQVETDSSKVLSLSVPKRASAVEGTASRKGGGARR
eukprot:Partr_v1_DN28139_c2_g1_i3_m55245 putative serine threonine-protein kinase